MAKTKSYIETYVERFKEDKGRDLNAAAAKAFNNLGMGLRKEYMRLNSDLISDKQEVKASEEAYANSMYNANGSVETIISCRNNVTAANDKLETTQAKIAALQEIAGEVGVDITKTID